MRGFKTVLQGEDFWEKKTSYPPPLPPKALTSIRESEKLRDRRLSLLCDAFSRALLTFLRASGCSCSKNIMARDCRDCLLSTLLIQALKFHIACDMSAKEVHDLGQKEVKRIRSRMDEVRKSRVSCGETREIRALADPS